MHAMIDKMIVTLTGFLLAFAPQTTTLMGEWLLTWDQMGPQYIRVSITQEGRAARATWENESHSVYGDQQRMRRHRNRE